MKMMTCKELGGSCDMEFYGETLEDVIIQSQRHGREMFRKADPAHLQSMHRIMDMIQTEEDVARWMADRRREFDAKPNRTDVPAHVIASLPGAAAAESDDEEFTNDDQL